MMAPTLVPIMATLPSSSSTFKVGYFQNGIPHVFSNLGIASQGKTQEKCIQWQDKFNCFWHKGWQQALRGYANCYEDYNQPFCGFYNAGYQQYLILENLNFWDLKTTQFLAAAQKLDECPF